MNSKFFNRQNDSDPVNGSILGTATEVTGVLQDHDKSPPFFCELVCDNGCNLLLGIGEDASCAQFSGGNGAPPYLMALRPTQADEFAEHEFLIGGTATAVQARFCLPFEIGVEIAREFVETGKPSRRVSWEEV